MDKTFEKSATDGKVIITETPPTPEPIVTEVDLRELKDKVISLQTQIDEERQKYIDQAEWEIAKRKEAREASNGTIESLQTQIAETQKIIDGAVAVGVKEVIAEAPVEEVIK